MNRSIHLPSRLVALNLRIEWARGLWMSAAAILACALMLPLPVFGKDAAQVSEHPIQALGKSKVARASAVLSGTPSGVPLYDHGDPTPEEQVMLELINRARMNPVAEAVRFGIELNEGITNDPVSPNPKQPLAFNPHLLQAARGHSTWMLDNDVFAHVQTNGSNPGDRMASAGYSFDGSYGYGENIAWRGTTGISLAVGPTVVQEHEDLFVDEGIEDRGHRRNILAPAFREVGVGVGVGLFRQGSNDFNSVMVTQDYALSDASPGPFLLGVVYRDSNHNGAYDTGEGLSGVRIVPAGAAFQAVSSTSGGYAIPITGLSGGLQVTFSGAPLTEPVTKPVSLTGENVKVDFEFNADTAPKLQFVPTSAHLVAPGQFEADVLGPVGQQVAIEVSQDLKTWMQVTQLTLGAVGAHFLDSSAGQSVRFYRAVKF